MKSKLALHGTSVEIQGSGVLICGKPGMGKSSLALQLIDRGALLIADDQTLLDLEGNKLILQPPPPLRGIMEVRGVGLFPLPFQEKSFLRLCIEISEREKLERLPKPIFIEYYGIKIPLLKLNKNDPLGALKVEMKLLHKDEFDVL